MHTTSTASTAAIPTAAATAVTAARGATQSGAPGTFHGGSPGGGDMLLHNLVLFAHVLGVVGLFVALGIEVCAVQRLRRVTSITQIGEWTIATRATHLLHMISTPLIVGSGLYLLIAQFGWTTAWVDVSLAVMLLLSSSGMLVSWRRLDTIGQMAASLRSGDIPATLVRKIHDPVLYTVTHMQVGVALGILYLMLLRPELSWSLVAIIVAALLGLVTARLTLPMGELWPDIFPLPL